MPPTTFLAHLGLSRKLRAHGKDPLSRSAMANYRSTFIGTEPEEPGPLPRSRSAPCLGYAMPEASDAKLQEETLAEYVQQLSDRSQALQPLANPPELIEPEVPQDTLPATGHEMPASKAASVGSKGHPHFCCGPCRHFFRGSGWAGGILQGRRLFRQASAAGVAPAAAATCAKRRPSWTNASASWWQAWIGAFA
ncbi:unnamed protein product [Effrenium voratum]|uniref:Uncharacterized protein n=1 Tax=Effrenium voratum TaxID=2562239 RepID=A0AA36MUB9_9DINO|nr:unnamed protein product [Effrenium voratum]